MLLYHRLFENNQLFNVTFWDSNRAKLFLSSTNPSDMFLLMLAVCLLAVIVLGFGFYLWFFFNSSEHSQVRLLNILNVYLSIGCIGGSVVAFIKILASGLGYPENSTEHVVVGFHMVAITVTFLIISLATFLNQFKPEVYLDLSVAWRHSVALPTIGLFCIIVENFILYHCGYSSENGCFKTAIRRFVLVQIPCLSFILQSVVLIDDVFGFKNVFKFVICDLRVKNSSKRQFILHISKLCCRRLLHHFGLTLLIDCGDFR